MHGLGLNELAAELDALLRIKEIGDWSGALNGLQVENTSGRITRVAAAVDANLTTVTRAAEAGADLLIVHHGLFWNGAQPQRGRLFRLWQTLHTRNLAVYSAHLPLDVHPELGNNILLARALGLPADGEWFLPMKGVPVGYRARLDLPRAELAARLEKAVGGRVHLIPGGPERCGQVAVITGGAGSELRAVAEAGVDTFVTGEGQHWTFGLAEELGVNLLYGGHYATETFGVKALAAYVAERHGVPWEFIDHPSGL